METQFYVVETSAEEIYEGSTMYSDPELATHDAISASKIDGTEYKVFVVDVVVHVDTARQLR